MKDEIYLYSLDGLKLTCLAEGFVGSAYATGREKYPWLSVTMGSFTSPGMIGWYDFTAPPDERWSVYRTTKLSGLSLDDFETQQVSFWNLSCTSADLFHQVWYKVKTVPRFRCPSYATSRRHLTEQRRHSSTVGGFSHPRLIHLFSLSGEGYGGFGISIDPFFSSTILTFLQHYRAILPVPNIRGGSEFGEDWHNTGTKERKVGYIMPVS